MTEGKARVCAKEQSAEPAPAKRRYNVQPKVRSRTCPYNDGVQCSSNLCASCGWNTKVAKLAKWSGAEDAAE